MSKIDESTGNTVYGQCDVAAGLLVTVGFNDLMSLARRLIAEQMDDVDEEFMAGRAHGIGSLHSEILMLAKRSAPAEVEPTSGSAVAVGMDLIARGSAGMIKAFGLGHDQDQGDAGNPVSVPTERDKLLTIIAAAYQVAGAYDAPAHILDVLADPEGATDAQVNAMLPYQPAQRQAQDAVACKCGRILAVCLATSCEHSELALVQRETAGDAGAAPTCRSSEKAQVMQEQSGAGLARQSTESGASLAPAPPQSVDSLVAMLVDRDTPPGMDDEVVDWDLHGKPITHRMVESFSKTAPRSDQLALELPTGAPVILNVGAAIDAAATEAAAQGVAGLNLPANRARATVLDEEMLATALWLYRRLHRCYGRPPTVERPIKALAALVGIDVADCLAERGPDPVEGGAQ